MGKPAGDTHRKGTVLYRVLWRGCDDSEATWEPKSCLTPELIAEFEESPATASTSHLASQPAAPSAGPPPPAQGLGPVSSPLKRSREDAGAASSPSASSPASKRQHEQQPDGGADVTFLD